MTTIRKARLTDIPLLGTMEQEFRRDERATVLKANPQLKSYIQSTPDRNQKVAGWMRKWIHSKNGLVLLAESKALPVGFATASIETNRGIYGPKQLGFIGFVFVRHQHRGQGISSLLMEEMLAWFRKRKIKHVSLSVMEGNYPARAIWKKWGFQDYSVWAWRPISEIGLKVGGSSVILPVSAESATGGPRRGRVLRYCYRGSGPDSVKRQESP